MTAAIEWDATELSTQRVILGGAFGREDPSASFERLDRFAELGGRLVETAYSYAHGRGKEVLAEWVRAHPGRVGVVTKVGHGLDGSDLPLDRATVLEHASESAGLLGGEPLEVLMLHCDDPTRSVTELADTLRETLQSGLARRVGVSNWAPDRLAAFAAEFTDDPVPPVASYQWSLATPVLDLIHAMGLPADADVLKTVEAFRMPLLCWSSQAQGYFARGGPIDGRPDPFETAENRARRDRCRVLAEDLDTRPEIVALAWTLNHPATWPTIGPSSVGHLESSLAAAQIRLSLEQLHWLEKGGAEPLTTVSSTQL